MTLAWKSGLVLQSPTTNDPLLDLNTQPSLDLQFATSKTLDDRVSGQNLITFSRSTTGTYVDSNGVIQTAAIDAPRFDHDPTTNASLGLLVEESRTNVMLYSEDFTNTYWTTQNGLTDLNTNGVLNPKGDQAYLYTANSGSARKRLITANTTPGAVSFVFSVYIKSAGARYVQLLWAPTGFDYCNFDLVAGTPGTKGSGISNPKITDVGDGWYRLSMYVQNTTPTQIFSILAVDSASATFAAPAIYTGEAFYLFGTQVEAGAFPTSYIPTSGSTVTRAADVVSITGSNFSKWYNQSEGTIFAEAKMSFALSQTSKFPDIYTSGTFPDRLWSFYLNNGGNGLTIGADTHTAILETFSSSPQSFKVAQALSNTSLTYSASKDGATPLTGSMSKAITDTSSISIGLQVGAVRHIARLTYYPYRLPDATLQEITS